MSREVELGCESWTSFASGCSSTAVQWTLSLWPCPARKLKQQLRSALVTAQWRFHCSGGGLRSLRSFSGGIRRRAFTLSPSSPPPPPPFPISNLGSVDVKQHGQWAMGEAGGRDAGSRYAGAVMGDNRVVDQLPDCINIPSGIWTGVNSGPHKKLRSPHDQFVNNTAEWRRLCVSMPPDVWPCQVERWTYNSCRVCNNYTLLFHFLFSVGQK